MKIAVYVAWAVFWGYWLLESLRAKPGPSRGRGRGFAVGVRLVLVAFLLARGFTIKTAQVHDTALEAVGVILFACGLAFAIWARVHLGRNWGMPMTSKAEPELVTSGPYRLVRHPIYTGILAAMLGTALAVNVYWLFPLAVAGAYFAYSAHVEERLMQTAFPSAYPTYRARTKMLIPFVL
jgi:protein-S-isoprenylcysteine O-methyltransferase Ste14